jgi:hypothetical protein
MTSISQIIDQETIISLFALAYEADSRMDDSEFLNEYGTSGFYYMMGKNFAMRDVFAKLGLTEAYKMYEREKDKVLTA